MQICISRRKHTVCMCLQALLHAYHYYFFEQWRKHSKFTLNTLRASRNTLCISLHSHWFHKLSLSTSSRDDGTSKSPRENNHKLHDIFVYTNSFCLGALNIDCCTSSKHYPYLGQWTWIHNFSMARRQRQAASLVVIQSTKPQVIQHHFIITWTIF